MENNILISKNWEQVIHAVISLSYYYYFYILWFIKKSLLIDHQTAQEFHKRGGWGFILFDISANKDYILLNWCKIIISSTKKSVDQIEARSKLCYRENHEPKDTNDKIVNFVLLFDVNKMH